MSDLSSEDKRRLPSDNGKRFHELYGGKEEIVYKFVHSRLRSDDIEDVFQESVVQGIEKIDTLKNPDGFLSWMYAVVQTTVADHWRRTEKLSGYEQTLDVEANPEPITSMRHNPEKISMDAEKMRMLNEAMALLDPESHLVVTLRFTEDMSYQEIADIIGIDVNGVKYRLKKAKGIIRTRMEKYFFGSLMASFNHDHIMALSHQAFEKAMTRHPELTAFGTATSVGTATGFTWSGVLAAVAFPFLWVMSLFFTGHVYGMGLVLSVPTLSMRRWLIRQLLYCYSTAFVFSTGLVTASILSTGLFGVERKHTVIAVVSVVLLALFGGLVWLTAVRYGKMLKILFDPRNDERSEGVRLEFLTRRVFAVTSVCLVVFAVVFCSLVAFPHARQCFQTANPVFAYTTIAVTCFMISVPALFHAGSYSLFRYFLSISKTPAEFQATYRPIVENERSSWRTHTIALTCVAFLMLLPSTKQLVFAHKRPLYAGIEFATFALCWYWVYRCNQRTTFWGGWLRIAIMFGIQFLILNLLLQTIYE